MDIKVVGMCFIEDGSNLIVDAAGNKIPAKSAIICINDDGDINLFAGGEMGVIYQAANEDFNFSEDKFKDLNAEGNQSIITSIFLTLTGTRCKTRRRQVTNILPMLITLDAASPTVIPNVAANPGMPVTNANPVQEASTTALNTQAMEEWELSAPETALPATKNL